MKDEDILSRYSDGDQNNVHVSSQVSVTTHSIHVHVGAMRRITTKSGILSGLKRQICKHRQVSFTSSSYCWLPQQQFPVHATQTPQTRRGTILPHSCDRRGQPVLSNTAPGLYRTFNCFFFFIIGMCDLAEVKWKVNGC